MEKHNKILLLYLPLASSTIWRISAALPLLKSYLITKGYKVECINLDGKYLNNPYFRLSVFFKKNAVEQFLKTGVQKKIKDSTEKLCKYLPSHEEISKLGAIGFSINNLHQFSMALCMVRYLKVYKNLPKEVTVIFGGPLFEGKLDSYINQSEGIVDYIVYGDGFSSLLKLCRFLEGKEKEIRSIPGIICKKDGKIIRTEPLCTPLDKLPTPKYADFLENYDFIPPNIKNNFAPSYLVGIGCSNKCKFCAYANKQLQFKRIKNIIKDIKRIRAETNTHRFFFSCNAININKRFLINLAKALKNLKRPIQWQAYAYPFYMSPKLCLLLADSGCKGLILGIESGSETTLKSMGKAHRLKEVEKTLAHCKTAGIQTYVNLLFGIPKETLKEKYETLMFIKKNRSNIFSLCCSMLEIRPQTEYHKEYSLKRDTAYLQKNPLSYIHMLVIMGMAKHNGIPTFTISGTSKWVYGKFFEIWLKSFLSKNQRFEFKRLFEPAISSWFLHTPNTKKLIDAKKRAWQK